MTSFSSLVKDLRACTICAASLPLGQRAVADMLLPGLIREND